MQRTHLEFDRVSSQNTTLHVHVSFEVSRSGHTPVTIRTIESFCFWDLIVAGMVDRLGVIRSIVVLIYH